MKFNNSYYHSMDRGYYISEGEESSDDLQPVPKSRMPETNLGPKDIGFGSNPFQRPIQAVNARLKQGVGYIDIPFFGAGKGNKERYTPESISKKERRDIRELAKINEAKLSTHASTNIQGLAGMNQNQGGFDENQREKTLKEIKKAIDFASDLQGGAVVFHTGEWPRPFSEQKWNEDKMFVNYPEEENRAVLHLVDERSGRIIGGVQKSQTVFEPEYEEYDEDHWVDLEGNPVPKDGDMNNPEYIEKLLKRKPKWNSDLERFETERLEWKDFEERAKKNGTTPEMEFYFSQKQEQLLQSRGQSLYYSSHGYEESLEQLKALQEAKKFYEQLEDNMPEDEKWKIMKQKDLLPPTASRLYDLSGPTKEMSPTEIIDEAIVQARRSVKHIHEAAGAADVRAQNVVEEMNNVKPVYEYGLDKSADTVARAAEFAWQKTRQKNPDRPIYVSPESYLPDTFGSHPDEIQQLIDTSRESFVNRMKQKGMNEKKAKELAEQHIRGTLDVGHFNMWRQHFKAKPDESPEETDKRFNNWYLDKIKGLVDSGAVGQIHITDNMGFDDEHLTPGQGTVPMEEVMKIVEDADIDDIIVEAGSFNPVDVVPETFEYFGSPVYSVTRGGPSFAQVHQQHFGYNAPPFYIVGAYSPSNEWTLWSDVQLE